MITKRGKSWRDDYFVYIFFCNFMKAGIKNAASARLTKRVFRNSVYIFGKGNRLFTIFRHQLPNY